MNNPYFSFIPSDYVKIRSGKLNFFYDNCATKNDIVNIMKWANKAYSIISESAPSLKEVNISICIFEELSVAKNCLKRDLSKTSLLVPYTDNVDALICCFSPSLDNKNNESERMTKHFIHEFSHIIISFILKFERKLGKCINIIPVWLDEGLSEYFSSKLLENNKKLNDAIEYYIRNIEPVNLNEMFNSYLNCSSCAFDAYKFSLGKIIKYIEDNNMSSESLEIIINKCNTNFA